MFKSCSQSLSIIIVIRTLIFTVEKSAQYKPDATRHLETPEQTSVDYPMVNVTE